MSTKLVEDLAKWPGMTRTKLVRDLAKCSYYTTLKIFWKIFYFPAIKTSPDALTNWTDEKFFCSGRWNGQNNLSKNEIPWYALHLRYTARRPDCEQDLFQIYKPTAIRVCFPKEQAVTARARGQPVPFFQRKLARGSGFETLKIFIFRNQLTTAYI